MQEADLFGSAVRGELQPHSDVDVAVFVAPDRPAATTLRYLADLTSDLMAALETPDVDLIVLNQAPPLLYARVLREGVRVMSRDLRASTRREGEALSGYCDFAPQLAKIEAAHRARILRGEFGQ
ncbi:MAG TPA: nucleotidyltransferase domain-containing protein [Thermoanaerobaculia bacterium]|nr:nucleotidyltransferase domain-containing protein [Thermoanaerobaculia bacterium]